MGCFRSVSGGRAQRHACAVVQPLQGASSTAEALYQHMQHHPDGGNAVASSSSHPALAETCCCLQVSVLDSPELNLDFCLELMSWNAEATQRALKLSAPGQAHHNCRMLFHHIIQAPAPQTTAPTSAGAAAPLPAAEGGAGTATATAHPGCLLEQLARSVASRRVTGFSARYGLRSMNSCCVCCTTFQAAVMPDCLPQGDGKFAVAPALLFCIVMKTDKCTSYQYWMSTLCRPWPHYLTRLVQAHHRWC